MGFFANSTVASTKIATFQCPSDRQNTFQVNPAYLPAGPYLNIAVLTKGNYGASWGNTFWAQDGLAVTSWAGPPADDRPGHRRPADLQKVGLWLLYDRNELTHRR